MARKTSGRGSAGFRRGSEANASVGRKKGAEKAGLLQERRKQRRDASNVEPPRLDSLDARVASFLKAHGLPEDRPALRTFARLVVMQLDAADQTYESQMLRPDPRAGGSLTQAIKSVRELLRDLGLPGDVDLSGPLITPPGPSAPPLPPQPDDDLTDLLVANPPPKGPTDVQR